MDSTAMQGEFHNMEPRTREERVAARARERLEEQNLKTRRGNFHVYQEHVNPVIPEPVSPMYADEANRFKRDVAGEMREQKVQALHRQQVRARARSVRNVRKGRSRKAWDASAGRWHGGTRMDASPAARGLPPTAGAARWPPQLASRALERTRPCSHNTPYPGDV